MSLKDGLAALNLEMPDRVPRTEFSAEFHWDLVRKVTGIEVDENSTLQEQRKASAEFSKAWNYDFYWSTPVRGEIFGDIRTKMGHAVYATGGVDFNDDIGSAFEEPEDVLEFDPWAVFGQQDEKEMIDIFNDDYDNNVKNNDDLVNTTGIYVTGISGAIELFGWDLLLLAAGMDPDGFGETMNRYQNWVSQYFNALAKSKASHVIIHDDFVWTEGAFIHPDWYRKFLFPNYKKLFKPVIESGKKIIFGADGNFTDFIDDIVDCGVHGFVMEPLTDASYIAEKYGKTHVFMGNVDTRVLLSGTKEDIESEVKRSMDVGKKCPGFFTLVGNHIPPNTPVDNCLYYNEFYEKYSKR